MGQKIKPGADYGKYAAWIYSKKPLQLYLLCLLMVSGFSNAQNQGIQPEVKTVVYHISAQPDNPNLLNASLTLPEPVKNGNTFMYTRGMALNILPQLINVKCNGQHISRNENGQWLIPVGCREILWEIELIPSEPFSLETSRQQSVLVKSDPPWILLSGFSCPKSITENIIL